ncbi:MAG: hypothetical protein HC810_05515 [Acaryochloridaceae cyanobacterium RL_2_7]|nr:hypothetical protein [Acaryochloridaceae cyanobacterium RL_2_7]
MGNRLKEMGLEILTFKQLEAQGAQTIAAGQLVFEQKQFRLGPAFSKRCYKAALDFCRIVRAESLLIDHENYLGIWLHYQKKTAEKAKADQGHGQKHSIEQALAESIHETSVTELFEATWNVPDVNQPPKVLAPEFIQSVQGALVEVIGPMGQLVMQRALRESHNISPSELIYELSKSIPHQERAQIFLMKFFPHKTYP